MAEKDMKLVFKLTRFEMQYPNFVRSIAPKIADEQILKPVHSRMKDFGYSEKIIQSTRIENLQISNLGELEFDVVSDYKSESGFDVSKAREEGTDDHELPKVPGRIYSWIAGGFIRAFSKGHWVKGITASNVIEKTVAEMIPVAQQKLNEKTDEFLQRGMAE